MDAEDDGEGACRQQLWAELFLVLKHRIILSALWASIHFREAFGKGHKAMDKFCSPHLSYLKHPYKGEKRPQKLPTPIRKVDLWLVFRILPLFEKYLFVIYAEDTVRGCNHPIIADLQNFVSFSKKISEIWWRKVFQKRSEIWRGWVIVREGLKNKLQDAQAEKLTSW